MSSFSRRKGSLRALRRKVPLHALPRVQPTFLLQMLIGLSQVVNGGAAKSEAVARALILDGQQRLRRLQEVAPHLDLSLAHVLEKIRPNDIVDEHPSDEETAVQAMLEMCLGLLLRWLSGAPAPFHRRASPFLARCLPVLDVSFSPRFSSLHLLFRARSCLIV